MKTVILCGGPGTRLSEETQLKPKPMVEIGGRPILWHIMKIYERHGFTDFVLALGSRGSRRSVPQYVSATSGSKTTGWSTSKRSRKRAKVGSTAVSSCSSEGDVQGCRTSFSSS